MPVARWPQLCPFLIAILAALIPPPALGDPVIYVDQNATGSTHDGSSWCNAFLFLQDALGVATYGTTVKVADGTYTPVPSSPTNPRQTSFHLVNGVTIEGAYAGCGAPNPNDRNTVQYETTLTGDLNGDDVEVLSPYDLLNEPTRAENSYHVVTGSDRDESAVLNGFTISGGNANNDAFPHDSGGGVYCDRGVPTITNCSITQNAAVNGGGLYFYRGSHATIRNCSIIGNAASHGGGLGAWLSSPTVTNCTIKGNNAYFGAGLYGWESNVEITNCAIANNVGGVGGGILCGDEGRPTVTGCDITGNTAAWKGGGIYASSFTNLTIRNCMISGNSAIEWGGGVASAEDNLMLSDSMIVGNTAGGQGGGIQCWVKSNATILNCLITENVAPSGGAIHCGANATPTIHNSILWTDKPQEIVTVEDCEITVGYSDVQGDWLSVGGNGHLIWREGNIAIDPMFVDPKENDYHLGPDSPCIDAGDPQYEVGQNEIDVDREFRISNGRIDMGADEYHDCNANDVADYDDISNGASGDCTLNSIPDECEPDCNLNGEPDSCDIANGANEDCTLNGIPDECEPDCNGNNAADSCDVMNGTSEDCNGDGVPDECIELENDCDSNKRPDECDTASGAVQDCNANGIPDVCEDTTADCNGNGIWDRCELACGMNGDVDRDGVIDECEELLRLWVDDDAALDPSPGDPLRSDPAEDGSRDHPYDAIQEAIDAARDKEGAEGSEAYFVEIIVADGNYTGLGNRDLAVHGRPYLVRSERGPVGCIIDCERQGRGFYLGFGETMGTRLQGLTIVNGMADYGGGVACENSSNPTISQCVITNNRARFLGGGIYGAGSGPILADCVIAGNITDGDGGGGHFDDASHPTIRRCQISGNVAAVWGGGLNFRDLCRPTIAGCTISDNTAGHVGGGIHYVDSHPTITHCLVSQNMANSAGGGIACNLSGESTISDSVIAGNSATNEEYGKGGGILSSNCHDLEVIACTITGNRASVAGGGYHAWGIYQKLSNCIFWGNTPDEIVGKNSAEITVQYSDVRGGGEAVAGDVILIWEDGNVEADPLFRNPDGLDGNPDAWEDNDYRLSSGSPCIDAGNDEAVPSDTLDVDADDNTKKAVRLDLDGHARVLCGRVDMGAYEFGIGDYDCDRSVTLVDFESWLDCVTSPNDPISVGCEPFDFDGDGDADLLDWGGFQAVFSEFD